MERSEKTVSLLDDPRLLRFVFHPRAERGGFEGSGPGRTMLIPVDDGVVVGARFHLAHPNGCNILFFHGNGEIVSDYDDLAPLYNRQGINFIPVDYRGYGRSTGEPTATGMLRDAETLFEYTRSHLADVGHTGPLIVMGRSLGSASALELASRFKDRMDGLIIESGFAFTLPLLQRLGAVGGALEEEGEAAGFNNLEKIRGFEKPTLIIHAEFDHIIPFADAEALFNACPAPEKKLLKIRGADHNSIFGYGLTEYMEAVKALAGSLSRR